MRVAATLRSSLSRSGLFIGGVGAYGHLGLNALQIATAMRAKQLAPTATPFVDASGDPIGMARASAIPDEVVGVERLVALGAPALREAAGRSRSAVPLFLAVPLETRPDMVRDASAMKTIVRALAEQSGVALDIEASRLFPRGHAGFADALLHAFRWAGRGEDEALVGGVDSPFDRDAARYFDERGWIAKEERDGARVPAEAAAFVRVVYRDVDRRTSSLPRLVAVDFEPGGSGSPGPALGRLLRGAARSVTGERLGWLLPDLNGEPARAEAFHAAFTHADELVEGVAIDELVQHCGDTGAATGALLTTIGVELWRMGAARTANFAVLTSSDDGDAGVSAWDLPTLPTPKTPTRGGFTASVQEVRRHVAPPAPGSRRPTAAEVDHMRRVARACLDDVGSMGLLLGPNPGEPDEEPVDPAEFAQRLLDAYDAFVALGIRRRGATYLPDLRGALDEYASSAPPNRARRFAIEFVAQQLAADE